MWPKFELMLLPSFLQLLGLQSKDTLLCELNVQQAFNENTQTSQPINFFLLFISFLCNSNQFNDSITEKRQTFYIFLAFFQYLDAACTLTQTHAHDKSGILLLQQEEVTLGAFIYSTHKYKILSARLSLLQLAVSISASCSLLTHIVGRKKQGIENRRVKNCLEKSNFGKCHRG